MFLCFFFQSTERSWKQTTASRLCVPESQSTSTALDPSCLSRSTTCLRVLWGSRAAVPCRRATRNNIQLKARCFASSIVLIYLFSQAIPADPSFPVHWNPTASPASKRSTECACECKRKDGSKLLKPYHPQNSAHPPKGSSGCPNKLLPPSHSRPSQ